MPSASVGELACREFIGLDFDESRLPSGDTNFKSRSDLNEYLGSIDGVGDGKPVLVYFHTEATKESGSRKVATKEAQNCDTLETTVLNGSNRRVGILGRYFVCKNVDVTNVQPTKNRIFNTKTAPTICLFDSSGKLTSHLTGRINAMSLSGAMLSTLRKSKIKVPQMARAEALLKQFINLENSKGSLESNRRSLQARLMTAKTKNNRGQVAQIERQIADATAKIDALNAQLQKIREALKELFSIA